MKYPAAIEKNLKSIEGIVSRWPVKKDLPDVINWMLQFEVEDFDLPYRILKNLNIIGPEELNSSLAIAYSKLKRRADEKKINISLKNTMFASVGGSSKSGAMIAYNFRLINELASANFLDDESIKYLEEGKVENLVLVDDIIASGGQSSKELQSIAEVVIPLGIKNIFVLTAVGMKDGIKKVRETELADVFSALEYDSEDTITTLDSSFYDGLTYDERKRLQQTIQKYGGYGFEGIGALIVFFYNTPNCTLPVIWRTGNGWLPLFQRMSDINGIDKHYPQLEKAIPVHSKSDVDTKSVTIFVEGKHDELFFEKLAEHNSKFGYDQVDVISIGPFYSEKLLSNLNKLSTSYVLVTEEEEQDTGHSLRVKSIVKDNLLVYMKNISYYFDVSKILESDLGPIVGKDVVGNDLSLAEKYIEMRLIKKCPANMKEQNMFNLVKNFSNQERIDALINQIKEKLSATERK